MLAVMPGIAPWGIALTGGCFVVNLIRLTGAIDALESLLSPLLTALGFPQQTLLLVITKCIAGGTAMMGIAMEQVPFGLISAQDINLLGSLLFCPLDIHSDCRRQACSRRCPPTHLWCTD